MGGASGVGPRWAGPCLGAGPLLQGPECLAGFLLTSRRKIDFNYKGSFVCERTQ